MNEVELYLKLFLRALAHRDQDHMVDFEEIFKSMFLDIFVCFDPNFPEGY